ncbi:hypothetical protein C8J55DRAFT_562089 [Lentinula edodes]|uniref:Uncharacterized protein n=1 Tax=Lentinula lateritia TaxID=40482 RepID=A0A9W9A8C4_9AGAR|nr:hypothetical protein C8J55DRAFT_562089 [Lentinula edodes]
MFASIFAPETLAGYWMVQNSDAEFPGDETDDEDDLPYLDLSEVHKGPQSHLFLKDIKFRKKPSSSTTPNAVAQYPDSGSSYESLSTSSASHPSVLVPTSFSEPISTQSWSSFSLSAQSLRKSCSQPEPRNFVECHSLPVKAQQSSIQADARLLNPPGLSEKALGKRKAFDDGDLTLNEVVLRNLVLPLCSPIPVRVDSVGQHELFSRTSAVSVSGLSTRFGGPQVSNNLVKIPSSQGNQNGHIHQFYSPHAYVQTSTQTNAHIPGLTSPPPIAVVGNPFLGDGAESGVEAEATIGQRGHDQPDTHCDDLKWAAEKFLVLSQNDPQQAKDVIEMLQLQRPGQTIAAGIGHEITNRNSSVHGDHRGVDVGEWLIPSLGTGRIPEAGDQVNSGIEPGLYSGLSRSSRAGIEISTPDHPAIQFGQQKHTSMPPDADDEYSLDFDVHFHTSVSALSATPATLASPSTVSSSLQELKATLNNGVDVIVISIESGSGLQKGGERSPTSRLTIPSPKLRLSDSATLEVPRPANPTQKAKGREKEKEKTKQVPANRRNWPLGSSDCNLKYYIKCVTVRSLLTSIKKTFRVFDVQTIAAAMRAVASKRGEIYVPLKKKVELASDNEPPELMTATQRRQRRKNANRKEMDLELETKEIEDRAPSESAGPSGENTIAWRRESKDRTRDHHIYGNEHGLWEGDRGGGCVNKKQLARRSAGILLPSMSKQLVYIMKSMPALSHLTQLAMTFSVSVARTPASAISVVVNVPAHVRSRQSEERPYPKLAPISVDTQVSHPVVLGCGFTGEVIASAYVALLKTMGLSLLGRSKNAEFSSEPVIIHDDMSMEPGPTASKRRIPYVGKPSPPSSDIPASPSEPMVSGMGNSAAHPVNCR